MSSVRPNHLRPLETDPQERRPALERVGEIANTLRIWVAEMIHRAQSGHPGGAFSSADYLSVLLFRHFSGEDDRSDHFRDRFVLSNGHAVPLLYAYFAFRGWLPRQALGTLRALNSPLQGHPNRKRLPLIDVTPGSLGQGLSIAHGLALGLDLQSIPSEQESPFIYCNLGDGEIQEGQVWEAAMSAGNRGTDSLIAMVDANDAQIDGSVESVMNLEPLTDKWQAFGWRARSVDGHSLASIDEAFSWAKTRTGRPTILIFRTEIMRGVPEYAGNPAWHGRPPDEREFQMIRRALSKQAGEINPH